MNDLVLKMVASQLGIPSEILDQMKAARPEITSAEFHGDLVTVNVLIAEPAKSFEVRMIVPIDELRRVPILYEKVVRVGRTN